MSENCLSFKINNCIDCTNCVVMSIYEDREVSDGDDEFEMTCMLSDKILGTTKQKNLHISIPDDCPLLKK